MIKTFTINCAYATDFVKDEPKEDIGLKDRIREGYSLDMVVFFPRCFVSEKCPAQRYRGYTLCTDRPDQRCKLTYRGAENEICRLGEYSLTAKQLFHDEGLDGRVLVIPGGRQAMDVLLVQGIPRSCVGIACPPDLKEGRILMNKVGTRSFLIPITKLEFDLKGDRRPVIQSCYENVIKTGKKAFLNTLLKAVAHVNMVKKKNLSPKDFISKNKI
jgi:hypothetical protein